MLRGDISNETPPRILVGIDVAVVSELLEEKPLFGKRKTVRKITALNNAQLSKLWNVSYKFGLSVELAACADEGWTTEDLEGLMNRLDNRGGNPFNYFEVYPDLPNLISELPYRTNLKGVVDIRGRVARYGSWGMELDYLD
jgi:hypothetical protein